MKLTLASTLIASTLTLAVFGNTAQTQGRLVVYCSATNEMCETETKVSGEKYGVRASFIHSGSSSALTKVDVEKKNPQADVWYSNTLDPQSQAGEMDLLQPYKLPDPEQIMEEFRDPAKVKGNPSSAVYTGILDLGVNTQRLEKKSLPVPKCWKDLARPEYKGEIQIADPQSSGTAYAALVTFAQLWGGDQAFDCLKQLNANVSQYIKSSIAPAYSATRGETAIDISFLYNYSLERKQSVSLELISPCGGTGYEVDGINILKGAYNVDNTKLLVDWVLSRDTQELARKKGRSYQILTNTTAETSPNSLKLDGLKLVNYDMDKYGSTDACETLISK